MDNEDEVERNIDAAICPLNEKEASISIDLQNKFFKPLKIRHWEGVEERAYWEAMKKS